MTTLDHDRKVTPAGTDAQTDDVDGDGTTVKGTENKGRGVKPEMTPGTPEEEPPEGQEHPVTPAGTSNE